MNRKPRKKHRKVTDSPFVKEYLKLDTDKQRQAFLLSLNRKQRKKIKKL